MCDFKLWQNAFQLRYFKCIISRTQLLFGRPSALHCPIYSPATLGSFYNKGNGDMRRSKVPARSQIIKQQSPTLNSRLPDQKLQLLNSNSRGVHLGHISLVNSGGNIGDKDSNSKYTIGQQFGQSDTRIPPRLTPYSHSLWGTLPPCFSCFSDARGCGDGRQLSHLVIFRQVLKLLNFTKINFGKQKGGDHIDTREYSR